MSVPRLAVAFCTCCPVYLLWFRLHRFCYGVGGNLSRVTQHVSSRGWAWTKVWRFQEWLCSPQCPSASLLLGDMEEKLTDKDATILSHQSSLWWEGSRCKCRQSIHCHATYTKTKYGPSFFSFSKTFVTSKVWKGSQSNKFMCMTMTQGIPFAIWPWASNDRSLDSKTLRSLPALVWCVDGKPPSFSTAPLTCECLLVDRCVNDDSK